MKTENQWLIMSLEAISVHGERALIYVDAFDTKREAAKAADAYAEGGDCVFIIKAEVPILAKPKHKIT